MIIDQLELIKNQTTATLRSKASGSVAKFRAETSLVKQASRLTGRMKRELDQAEKNIVQTRKTGRYRMERENVVATPHPVKAAPDGYVRRSAVQTIRVPEDYHWQILRRVLGGTVAVICVLVVIWLLLRSNLLTN